MTGGGVKVFFRLIELNTSQTINQTTKTPLREKSKQEIFKKSQKNTKKQQKTAKIGITEFYSSVTHLTVQQLSHTLDYPTLVQEFTISPRIVHQ